MRQGQKFDRPGGKSDGRFSRGRQEDKAGRNWGKSGGGSGKRNHDPSRGEGKFSSATADGARGKQKRSSYGKPDRPDASRPANATAARSGGKSSGGERRNSSEGERRGYTTGEQRSYTGNERRSYTGNERRSPAGRTPVRAFSDQAETQIARVTEIPDEERLEGRNSVTEALAANRTFNKVWYLKPLPDKQMDHRLSEIIRQLAATDAVLYPVERKVLDRMAVTPSHQGIIAQVAAHEYVEVEDILARAEEKGEKPFILLLDQIQDSQNLGAIMRTADACGVHGIVIPRRRSVALDAAAAKSSAGAVEYVPVARVTNLNRTIEELKERGVWIAGLSQEGDDLFTSDKLDLPLALVIGSEGEGMSAQVSENCDFHLRIPMVGKINSLNASNAAAIAMYEVFRQRNLVKE